MSNATVRDASASPAGAWLEILRLTGRLLARHWPALVFWFLLQRVVYDLSMQAAIALAGPSLLLAYAALAVLVVSQLVTVIAMFLCLRPSLPMLNRRDVPTTPRGNRWTGALAVALLPFFAYYTTWGLLEGLRRDFQLTYIFWVVAEQQVSLKDVLGLPWLWLALAISWAVRHVSLKRAKETGAGIGWSLLATACEAYWVFVGARAISQGIGTVKTWWTDRAAHQWLMAWWDDPRALFHLLAPIKQVLMPLWDIATTAFSGVVLPLIWLAITAIIYGMDLRRSHKLDSADESLARLGARYSALPLLVRKVAGKASEGWTSKGVPVVNSLRLVLRAGLPAVVVLCVCYQLLDFVDSYAWRVVVHLLGPHDPAWWNVIGNPIALLFGSPLSLRPPLLTELLRVALLAATCDCAIARLQTSQAAAPEAAPAAVPATA
ncbi:hypothetical protein [Dokdonella sp.]|uniref:hypothetical protein n=1 Tax=Dokdonella sp. TaxID=2291710 RepID=UPI001B01EF1A|nr:hypothetical protein [Dokdonella sp.]MBO9664813.1 hypothetical protein [Dokdonella sp.]